MPRSKGTLQPAARGDNETVKPVAPPDLWAKMDRLRKEVSEEGDTGITAEEWANRYKVTLSIAHHQLDALRRDGKVIRGRGRRNGRMLFVYRPSEGT